MESALPCYLALANVTNVHVADTTAGSYQVYMYKTQYFQQYSKLLPIYVVCMFY